LLLTFVTLDKENEMSTAAEENAAYAALPTPKSIGIKGVHEFWIGGVERKIHPNGQYRWHKARKRGLAVQTALGVLILSSSREHYVSTDPTIFEQIRSIQEIKWSVLCNMGFQLHMSRYEIGEAEQ
jgi:hypothetical protein